MFQGWDWDSLGTIPCKRNCTSGPLNRDALSISPQLRSIFPDGENWSLNLVSTSAGVHIANLCGQLSIRLTGYINSGGSIMCSILFVSIVSPELGILSQDSTNARKSCNKIVERRQARRGYLMARVHVALVNCEMQAEEGSHTLSISSNNLASVWSLLVCVSKRNCDVNLTCEERGQVVDSDDWKGG